MVCRSISTASGQTHPQDFRLITNSTISYVNTDFYQFGPKADRTKPRGPFGKLPGMD